LKFIHILLIVWSIGVACSSKPDAQATSEAVYTFDWPKIKERGKLVALVDNSSTSYFIFKGQPLGFEYEMLRQFCQDARIDLEVKVISSMDKFLQLLYTGEGDVVAANVTVTRNRLQDVAFSETIFTTRQMLVQRKNGEIIRDPLHLEGKEIVVRGGSSFHERLRSLNAEIGGGINIRAVSDSNDQNTFNKTIQLIDSVAAGHIDFTIADENVARVEAHLRPNLDVETPISLYQRIAWAFRTTDTLLQDTIDQWLIKFKNTNEFHTLYTKYFKARTLHAARSNSDFSSAGKGKISPFDPLIKKYAREIGWDWRLLAALIYKESKFDAQAEAWTGACGLMQLIPQTAVGLGLDTHQFCDPEANIRAGTLFLRHLSGIWLEKISDTNERIKFVLASFNAGPGHVLDARALTEKYNGNKDVWEGNVEKYLLLKSQEPYYTDPVCKHGYCRGKEPVNYVQEVLEHYAHYKNLL
jgi:membrane-bound lytic murein transglycosylase F